MELIDRLRIHEAIEEIIKLIRMLTTRNAGSLERDKRK